MIFLKKLLKEKKGISVLKGKMEYKYEDIIIGKCPSMKKG